MENKITLYDVKEQLKDSIKYSHRQKKNINTVSNGIANRMDIIRQKLEEYNKSLEYISKTFDKLRKSDADFQKFKEICCSSECAKTSVLDLTFELNEYKIKSTIGYSYMNRFSVNVFRCFEGKELIEEYEITCKNLKKMTSKIFKNRHLDKIEYFTAMSLAKIDLRVLEEGLAKTIEERIKFIKDLTGTVKPKIN